MKTNDEQLQEDIKQYNRLYKKAWPQMILLYGMGVAILSNLSTNIIDHYVKTIYDTDGYIIYSICVLGLTAFAVGGVARTLYVLYFRSLNRLTDEYMARKRRIE